MTEPDVYLSRLIARLSESTWMLKPWSASSALFPKDDGPSAKFHGQEFDPAKYELVEEGWSHDHCPFCWVTISDETTPDSIAEAYTNGYDWVCPSCYVIHLKQEE